MRRWLLSLALLPLLALPLTATAQEPPADGAAEQQSRDVGMITGFIETRLSNVTREVRIDGFEGALSSRATIDALTVSDRDGAWLVMEDLVLDWDRAALLRGRVQVQELTARRIALLRPPLPDPAAPSAGSNPLSIPELPVSISIGAVIADRIELGDAFLGEALAVQLGGDVLLADGSLDGSFSAIRVDDRIGQFIVDLDYDKEQGALSVTLIADEAPGGLAARALNLPGAPSVRLEVLGFGQVEDFTASVRLETDDTPRLTGAVNLAQVAGLPTRIGVDLAGDLAALFTPEYGAFFGGDSRLVAQAVTPPEGGLHIDQLMLDTSGLDLSGGLVIGPDGWPDSFDLNGRITGDDGAVLLPLPGPRTTIGGLDLTLTYDAARSPDWSADLTLSDLHRRGLILPVARLSGGGVIEQPDGRAGRWTLDLDHAARGIQLTSQGLSQALGDALTGRISAQGGSARPTEIHEVSLRGPGLDAQISGRVQGRSGAYATRLTARLEGRQLERFSGLAGRALRGAAALDLTVEALPLDGVTSLTITGDTQDIAIGDPRLDPLLAGPGRIDVSATRDPDGTRVPVLDIHTDHARIEAQADLRSDRAEALLIAAIPDASLLSPQFSGDARITATLARGGDQVSHIDLAADLPGTVARIEARVRPRLEDYATWLNGVIDARNLGLYSDIAGRDLDGAATLNLIGNAHPLSGAFGVAISAQTSDLRLGEPRLDPLLHGAGFLSAALLRDDDGRLSLNGLDLSTRELTATGSGRLDGTAVTADFSARLRDAALVAPELSGPVQVSGQASQTETGGTRADISASAPGLTLELDATVAPLSEDPARSLATLYNVSVEAADLSPYSGLAGRALNGSLHAQVQGSAAPRVQAFDARIDAVTRDLALGVPSLDRLLAGAGHLRGRAARGTDGAIRIEGLDAATPQLSASGDLHIAPGTVAADLRARIEDLALLVPQLPGAVDLTLTSEPAGDATRLRLDGTGPGVTLDATAVVDDADPALPAQVTLSGVVPRLSALRTLTGLPLGGSARIEAEGTARIADGSFDGNATLATTDLGLGSAELDTLLRGNGQLRSGVTRTPDGALSLTGLSATFPNLRASGNLALDAGGVETDFTASLPDLERISPQLTGRISATGQARIAGGQTSLDITASGDGGLSARIAGALSGGQADLTITGAVPLAAANRAIAPQALSGRADLDLTLRGTPGLQALSGVVRIADGRLSEPASGQSLDGISGSATLTGASAQLALTAAPSAGGRLTLTGPVTLTGAMPADLVLDVQNVVIRDPSLFETTASGRISLRGPVQRDALIAGRIELGETELRVPSGGTGMLGALPEIRHSGAPGTVRQTLERAGLSVAGIDLRRGGSSSSGAGARDVIGYPLDLTIAAPSRVFIRGRGLDAELGGSLTLRGDSEALIPSGRFQLIRGRIDILQQRFDLTEGFATLEGDFSPWLKLVASTETDEGGIVSIIVEGDASAPEVRFESLPKLPEDEVLSRLIFGRDLSSITPLQAVQLAAAVNTLAGRGGGGIVARLRDSVGLDDLDITSDGKGNTAVTAGKYISEDLYTNVTVASDGSSRVDLNLDLSDDLTVRGGTGTDGESSLGIFFERDY